MKKHLIFGIFLGLCVVFVAFAQTGHLRVIVETSPLARQLLTNDTAASWNAILGSGGGGGVPALFPAQIFVGNASSNAQSQTLTGDASLNTAGVITLSANFPRLNQANTFPNPILGSSGGNIFGSGFTVSNPSGATSTFNISGNPGSGGISVALNSTPSGLSVSTPVTSATFNGALIGSLAGATGLPSTSITGIIPTANLGTGTANSGTFLNGANQWVAGTGGGIAVSGGSGTNTSISNLTTTGVSTFWGTNVFTNAIGNAAGFTNYQTANLSGADNVAFFGLGQVPRQYVPAGSFVPNWGCSPVFSSDGIHWNGASGYPVVFNTNYSSRDASLYRIGNTYFAAVTADVGGTGRSIPFVNIYTSTNGGAQWFFSASAYFTNASLSLENPSNTYAPEFFTFNGSPYLIASCFYASGATHTFRVIQCVNGTTFASWSQATNVNMTGILSSTANDPFLYDDTSGSGNWYLWTANTSLTLYKSTTPIGPWTEVINESFNGGICEGPAMIHLPSGKYRLYTDQYFNGAEAFSESSTIESGWSSLTNLSSQFYFGHFTPIMLTNIQDITAAENASVSTANPNWSPFIYSPTFSSASDFPHIDFGPTSSISGNSQSLSFGYRYSEGFELNVSNYSKILVAGENGVVSSSGTISATNGFSSLISTNGSPAIGSITITATGLTNTLTVDIFGYLNSTNASSLTNWDHALTMWSTNTGPNTNLFFLLQPGAAITAAANAIDIAHVTWHGH